MSPPREVRDAAYGLHLVCGGSWAIVALLNSIPMDTGTAGGVGMFVALPLVLLSLLAGVGAVAAMAGSLGDRRLLALGALVVAVLVDFFVEAGPPGVRMAVRALYVLAATTFSIDWFARRRSQEG